MKNKEFYKNWLNDIMTKQDYKKGVEKMNKLSQAIEQVKQECIDKGKSGYVFLEDDQNTVVAAEWEIFEKDNDYDVLAVYLIQNGEIKMSYQVAETKIKV